MKNKERNLVKIINEICKEENIKMVSYSDDWIFRLTKNGISKHILGYRFELNNSSVDAICNDKCAASDILIDNNIECIKHTFFLSPSNLKYTSKNANWEEMINYFKEHKRIVCKPNEGTGGNNVIIINNQTELEQAVTKVFSNSRGLALCPYHEIKNEYRVIILNNNIKLIYLKQTPFIIGNGKDTVLKLIADSNIQYNMGTFDKNINYYYIPPKNEIFRLNWKYNLGLGASAKIVSDDNLIKILSELAIKAAAVLNIKFASIDIVETDNTYKVLEINSEVMMDYFSNINETNYKISKQIYKEAIDLMFQNK